METDEQQTEKDLYIPVNVMDSNDYIAGFGSKELAISAIATAIALGIAITLYIVTQNVFMAIMVFAIIILTTISLIFRDKCNESIIDKIHLVILYCRRQKTFVYRYYNIYEGRMTE